jgi:HAD superfamily hydrolase (TIGR01509 family)
VTDPSHSAAGLLDNVRCLLFDFDGPLCGLFAGHPAEVVAERMVAWLEERGLDFYAGAAPTDPMEVLRDAGHKLGEQDVARLEEFLTGEEVAAVDAAEPTPDADRVVRALAAGGVRLAVASNNGRAAVAHYLARRGLTAYFGDRLHGRAADPALMKPHPDSVRRALRSAGTAPAEALMVGDSATDFQAADQLGIPFLGFAKSPRHDLALRHAGATHTISAWRPLLTALTPA